MTGDNRNTVATTLNKYGKNGLAQISLRPRARAVTEYWHSNSLDESALSHHSNKKQPKKLHKRGYSSDEIYFRSSKHAPFNPNRFGFDPKTHRRILSPLQYAPKHPPVAPPAESSLSSEGELHELQDQLCNAIETHGSMHPSVALAYSGVGNFHFRHGNFPLAFESYIRLH